MIKFKDLAFVRGVMFTSGMIAEFDAKTEADLIKDGDAEVYIIAATGTIENAINAQSAINATNAINAQNATTAATANYATTAGSAATATSASVANSATVAITATSAINAENAATADHATTADTASTAGHATTATTATTATNADMAAMATTALNANNATTADFAISTCGEIKTYTWDTRPVYAKTDVGTIININDVGGAAGSLWRATSFGWVPLNGSVKLASKWGSIVTPVATVNATSETLFTITGEAGSRVIPATMMIPGHTVLRVRALLHRRGANATAAIRFYLGTAGTIADAKPLSWNWAASNLNQIRPEVEIGVVTSASLTSTNWLEPGDLEQVGGPISSLSTNINTNADMTLNFGLETFNSGDFFDLIGYSLVLESL